MYDFANSGYTTVVLTAVFNAYFVGVVAGNGADRSGTATLLWTVVMAITNVLVLASAPILGAIADHGAHKKRFLAFTTVGCVFFTILLGFVGRGDVALGMTLVILATLMFASGENFIAAFLPEIAEQKDMGRISGYGWSLGYLGGLLVLGMCLVYIQWAQSQGDAVTQYVPVTMWITAVMFALAALPTFIWLRARAAYAFAGAPLSRSVPVSHHAGGVLLRHQYRGRARRHLRARGDGIQHAGKHHVDSGGERYRRDRGADLRSGAGPARFGAHARDHAAGVDCGAGDCLFHRNPRGILGGGKSRGRRARLQPVGWPRPGGAVFAAGTLRRIFRFVGSRRQAGGSHRTAGLRSGDLPDAWQSSSGAVIHHGVFHCRFALAADGERAPRAQPAGRVEPDLLPPFSSACA